MPAKTKSPVSGVYPMTRPQRPHQFRVTYFLDHQLGSPRPTYVIEQDVLAASDMSGTQERYVRFDTSKMADMPVAADMS